MLFKSLRTSIVLNLVVLLLLSMLLIDVVILMVMQKMFIDARLDKGRIVIAALTSNLRMVSTNGDRDWRMANPEQLGRLLETADGLCMVAVALNGRKIYRGGVGCISETILTSMAYLAAREDRDVVRSPDFFRGIFAGQPGNLAMAAPLRLENGVAGGAGILMPVGDIYGQVRRSQHILLVYTLINTFLLTLLGVYRLGNLIVKPIQRLVRRAEAYRESDDAVFLLDKEDNEFSMLSKSLNRMLIHLARDKDKLQASVHSLERANQDLEKAQRELIRAEKLASVGRLSAGIAHEIGNPIGIIKGYLTLMNDPSISDEEKADFVARTESEVERIHSIIQQLLDFARPSGEEQTLVSVHGVLEDLEEVCRFQPALGCIRIALQLGAAEDHVVANARQLRQVFLNLVLNAADAVREVSGDGELDIHTEICPANSDADDRQGSLVIRFSDDGGGIPEERLTHIFDPFYTTKAPGKGTGLGLSVSFTIIEGLGGSLKAERNEKGGTSMVITLPLAVPTTA
jgi:signal transduction histidine kinase